jgi:3-phenylpropionate/cinnamic acid dioxygenase small subunit
MTADALQSLLDVHEIERALYRAARAMDDHDWATLREVFAEDATGDLGTRVLTNRESIIAVIRDYLESCGPTQHLLGNVIVDVTGDKAISRAYIHDVHLASDSTDRFYTLGDYHPRRERRAGRWLVVERAKANRAYVGRLESVFAAQHPDT